MLLDLMLAADSSFQNVGSTFTQRSLPTPTGWVDATWGNPSSGNMFFAIVYDASNGANAASSPDGITWTHRTLPLNAAWNSCAYGNGTYVAISAGVLGTSYSANSPDGITWTQRGNLPGTYNSWYATAFGVISGVSTFVSVGGSTTAGSISTNNGVSWSLTTLPTPTGGQYRDVAFGNNTFVAVAQSTNIAATSPDGVTWTQRTLPSTAGWLSVAYGNGVFVAVEFSGSSAACATSPDGITWTAQTMPGNSWITLSFGNGVFVAAANNQSWVATSTNGVVWIMRPLPISSSWRCSAYGNETFVILDNNNGDALSSP